MQRISLALVLISFLTLPSAGQVVWDTGPGANGHTYLLSTVAGTQDAVRVQARALGGYLVSITSQEEKDFLLNNLAISGAPWIGLSDEVTPGTWLWDSGEALSWTDWCPGEPSNGANEQAALFADQRGGCWLDTASQSGGTARLGIIEIPADTAEAYHQKGREHLVVNGVAGPLGLTTASSIQQAGSIFRATPKPVVEGFTATFRFQIANPTGGGGEGFAFVLHGDETVGATALGSSGADLGAGGIPNALVIAFDFWDPADPNREEVRVHLTGPSGLGLTTLNTLGAVRPGLGVSQGGEHLARVQYVPGRLEVFIDDLSRPILQVGLDLAFGGRTQAGLPFPGLNLIGGDRAFVGATASTGAAASQDCRVFDFNWNIVPIRNPGFDEDNLPDGTSSSVLPTGWRRFPGTEARNPVAAELPWADYSAPNIALAQYSPAIPSFITNYPEEPIRAGWTYRVSVRAGRPIGTTGQAILSLQVGRAASQGVHGPDLGETITIDPGRSIVLTHDAIVPAGYPGIGENLAISINRFAGGHSFYVDDLQVRLIPPMGLPPRGPLLGRRTLEPVNLDPLTSNNGHLGVVEANGSFYVSARRPTAGSAHQVYRFDRQGNLLDSRDQPSGTGSSAWGYRDGCFDGTFLNWAFEGGIDVLDGNHLVVSRIQGAGLALLGTYRALAYDPNGDGGQGSWWTANFESPLIEIDRFGNILTQHPWNQRWSIYGLARDPITGNLWASSSRNRGDIVEIDPVTGRETGIRFPRAMGGSPQGGLSGVVGSAGENAFDLVAIDQTSSGDRLTRYRVHRDAGRDATHDPILGVSFDQNPLLHWPEIQTPTGAALLQVGFDTTADPTGLAGLPCFLVANVGGDTAVNADLFGIPDWRSPLGGGLFSWTFPAPTEPVIVLSDGLGLGSSFGLPLPIGPAALGSANLLLPLGAPLPPLRFQALYLDPRATTAPPLAATNTVVLLP